MTSSCLDIIVNIQNYNSALIYNVFIRLRDSLILPITSVVATSSQVVISGLTPNDYEIGVQTTCTNGTKSLIHWAVPSDPNCGVLVIAFADPDFTITLPSVDVTGFEWRVDEGAWTFVASAATLEHTLNYGDVNTALNGYLAARETSLIDFQFRVKCSIGKFSPIIHYYYINTPIPIGKVSLLKTLCTNSIFTGMLMRITIGADTLLEENLWFHDTLADVLITNYTRTNSMDADIAFYKAAIGGFNPIRKINNADPSTALAVSIDFISRVSPQGSAFIGDVPCGDYPLKYEIILD